MVPPMASSNPMGAASVVPGGRKRRHAVCIGPSRRSYASSEINRILSVELYYKGDCGGLRRVCWLLNAYLV